MNKLSKTITSKEGPQKNGVSPKQSEKSLFLSLNLPRASGEAEYSANELATSDVDISWELARQVVREWDTVSLLPVTLVPILAKAKESPAKNLVARLSQRMTTPSGFQRMVPYMTWDDAAMTVPRSSVRVITTGNAIAWVITTLRGFRAYRVMSAMLTANAIERQTQGKWS
jgi:hypothetical protein